MTDARDRPAEVIEVTPEMLAAGLSEMMCHELTEGNCQTWVEGLRAAFIAMSKARLK